MCSHMFSEVFQGIEKETLVGRLTALELERKRSKSISKARAVPVLLLQAVEVPCRKGIVRAKQTKEILIFLRMMDLIHIAIDVVDQRNYCSRSDLRVLIVCHCLAQAIHSTGNTPHRAVLGLNDFERAQFLYLGRSTEVGRNDLGIGANFGCGAFGELFAVVEYEDVVGEIHHQLHVVFHQNNGDA